MTKEEQRIAIAQACGSNKQPCDRIGGCFYDLGMKGPCKCDTDFLAALPDYCSDLNAIHAAEISNIYDKNLGLLYLETLQRACNELSPAKWDETSRMLPCTSATAGQRAEAFLRVLNLWKDTE